MCFPSSSAIAQLPTPGVLEADGSSMPATPTTACPSWMPPRPRSPAPLPLACCPSSQHAGYTPWPHPATCPQPGHGERSPLQPPSQEGSLPGALPQCPGPCTRALPQTPTHCCCCSPACSRGCCHFRVLLTRVAPPRPFSPPQPIGELESVGLYVSRCCVRGKKGAGGRCGVLPLPTPAGFRLKLSFGASK